MGSYKTLCDYANLIGAFNQEKALVGAFSVIVQPAVEPMEHYTALERRLISSGGHEPSFADHRPHTPGNIQPPQPQQD